MNTILLNVIRSEAERRRAPAVQAMLRFSEQAKPIELRSVSRIRRLRNHFGEAVRTARQCAAVRLISSADIILPDTGHKLEEAREELLAAGVKPEQVQMLGERRRRFFKIKLNISTLLLMFPIILQRCLIYSRIRKNNPYSAQYFNVICAYSAYKQSLLKVSQKHWWLIIGDLSPFLIALAGAAKMAGQKIISWQYGYQDFKHYPVKPNVAIVLNQEGISLTKIKDTGSTPIFQRKTISISPLELKNQPIETVGVVLNAFSRKNVVDTIKSIQAHIGCSVKLRPHPRDASVSMEKLGKNNQIFLANEGPLEDFCQSVDWVICGNTTSALKIRAMGYPVCQFFGFDNFFDDHFEYEKLELLPSFKKINDIEFEAVKEFYQRRQGEDLLKKMLGKNIERKAQPLSDLPEYL